LGTLSFGSSKRHPEPVVAPKARVTFTAMRQ
jgi:hypothetical protein